MGEAGAAQVLAGRGEWLEFSGLPLGRALRRCMGAQELVCMRASLRVPSSRSPSCEEGVAALTALAGRQAV